MTPKLTQEQREAISQSGGLVALEDEATSRRYFLVEAEAFSSWQRGQDLEAIRQGIEAMERGEGAPLEDVMAEIRAALNLPSAT